VGWSLRLHCMNPLRFACACSLLAEGLCAGWMWEPAWPKGGMDGIMDHPLRQ
jgi:hypothetical protein